MSLGGLACVLSEGEEFTAGAPGSQACLKPVCIAGDSHPVGGDPKLESADVAREHVSAQVRPRGLCHT